MADGHLHIVDKASSANQRPAGVLPPPLRMLRDRAERHFAARLKGVFEQVDDTFFDLADRADNYRQQTRYFDAMRLIRFERKTIESAFQQSVGLAFDSLVDEALSERRAATQLGSNAFELADGEELEEIIALDTMVSRADESNRQQLQYLAMRLESLTSRPVALKDNPLGPDIICDSFFRATAGLDIGIRSKLVLLKLFERHVVTSLGDFLQQSNQLLQELAVLPELESRQGAPAQPIRGKQPREKNGDIRPSPRRFPRQGQPAVPAEKLWSAGDTTQFRDVTPVAANNDGKMTLPKARHLVRKLCQLMLSVRLNP